MQLPAADMNKTRTGAAYVNVKTAVEFILVK